MSDPIEHVAILPNKQGGYSLHPAEFKSVKLNPNHTDVHKVLRDDHKPIGNYATQADAQRVADQNCWSVINDPTSVVQTSTLHPHIELNGKALAGN